MPDTTIKPKSAATLGTVEGDLKAGANARLSAADGKKITVTGGAYFEGPVTIGSSIECRSLRVEGRGFGPGGDVIIRGDLTVHGDADVVAHMQVEGEVKSENLDISGHFKSRSVASKRLRVGGHMNADGTLEAEAVDVGGHFTVSGAVKISSLDVGGHARIGGGDISGKAKIMGHFESSKSLAYGELDVLGHIRLPAGSTGNHLSIRGSVRFDGDTSCKDLKVTGVAKVGGGCSAETIDVYGKLDVSGPLNVSNELRVFGATEVKQQIQCGKLVLGGKLDAERVLVGDSAQIAGDLGTEAGLKAASIVVGRSSRVRGPLVGNDVLVGATVDLDAGPMSSLWSGKWLYVGRFTRVGDVYGKSVRLERNSQTRSVYAEVIRMDEGSMADQVTYSSDLKLPQKYHFNKPPTKAAKLPDPPL